MKIRRLHLSGIAFLFLIAIVFVAISYFHFRGIENSLERLVEQKTKGQYKLDMGETHYDFLRLDFILKDARIYRIDTLSKKRIYSVQLPYVKINLGSLESYFSFGQINIKEFLIEEPFVELRKGEVERHQLRLSSELSRMLAIVKELLDSFNVHSFKIAKGSFALNKEEHTVRIGLIDLLAKEWNVRKLTKESELRVNLGAQNLDILNHRVSFNQIEYSYLKRQLIISDFSYDHVDSLSGMKLDVKADNLIISHLDWKQLSLEERYKLKKVELIHPQIHGTFPLASRKKKKLNPMKTFQDMVGELMIDSIMVRDADVDLAYVKLKDTTSVSFAKASFSVTAFKLLESKETFEVGEVKFNLNKTELIIGKKYVLRFDSLSFNHYLRKRLYVEGFQFAERNSTKPLLESRQVFVNRFNPFDFLMDKKINAESLELSEVRLIVSPELLKKKNHSETKNDININLNTFQLSNATIEYSDKERSGVIKSLNARIRNVKINTGHSPLFDFDFLLAKELNFQEKGKLNADFEIISLTKEKLFAKAIVVSQTRGLAFRMQNTSLNFDSFEKKIPRHFSSVNIQKFLLVGSTTSSSEKQSLPEFELDRLTIDTVLVNVSAKDNKINLHALNFSVSDLRIDSALLKWGPVKTKIRDLSFENALWKMTTRNSRISTDSLSRLNQFAVFKKDSTLTIESTALELPAIIDYDRLSEVNLIRPRIKFHSNKNRIESITDSISIKGLNLVKKQVEEVTIFQPVIKVELPDRPNESRRRNLSLDLPDAIGNMKVINATVTIEGRRAPLYVHGADLQLTRNGSPVFLIDSVHTEGRKDEIIVKGIESGADELLVRALSITPLQSLEKYGQTGFERDYLKLEFNNLRLKGFNPDSILHRKGIKLTELKIGGFRIDVLRDKRLPDPPFIEKGLFSRKLYTASRTIDIPSVLFEKGSVSIHQISDKTNETGELVIDNIAGEIRNLSTKPDANKKLKMNATTQIFGKGEVKVDYEIKAIDQFSLDVDARDLDFQLFNPMIQPLQSVRFKSGKLKRLKVNATADDSVAVGEALINYTDLKIEIRKADRTEFRNDFLSAVANEIIKNKRKDAVSPLTQEHEKGKAEFTYWAKILMKGASGAARHGKKKRKK